MKIKLLILSFLFTGLATSIFAQADSVNLNKDSINAAILNDYNEKLKQIEIQRIADSIKRAELELQLGSLQTTDNLQKEELQKQLDSLNQKDNERLARKKASIDSLRLTAQGFAVEGFFGDTLFYIYSKLGSFSAKDRATAISERIHKLADDYNFKPDSLKLIESESTIDLMFKESIVISLTENDALWNNMSKLQLAESYKKIIGDAVMEYKDATSAGTILKEIGLALLVILIISIAVFYIIKLFKWTAEKIILQEGKKIKGIKIRNYVLFDEKREIAAFLLVNKILKWFTILLVAYIGLPILFGIFPWTQNFADTLFGYILNPIKRISLSFWNFLPNLITIVVIFIIFRYAMKGVKFLKKEIEEENLKVPGFFPDWANPTYQIIRVLLIAFMIVVIFPYLPGSDSPVFQGVSVFLGFLFTFGSAGSLSNIIAGLVLTYMRLFKVGDRVKIGDVVGDVIEKTLLVTRIRTIKNEIISIPNSTVMSSHTINYSRDAPDKGLIIHTTVTIGYDVPWRDMHQTLIDAALRTNLILPEPKPFVLQTSLDDFYVSYQLNAYVREANKQAVIYSDLHQNIQDVCNENGIEILSPHYRAARDGNTTTIPQNYLDKDYKAPSFNVKIEKEK